LGKKAEAIQLYRKAFEIASSSETDPKVNPIYDATPQFRRYQMPIESEIRSLAKGLVEQADWSYAEWKEAVPPIAVARLAVARLMSERGSPEAEAAFDHVLAVVDPSERGASDHFAARAEALAFRQREAEAVESYEKAIETAASSRDRRLYSFNLAEVLRPLAREEQRAKLLEAAIGTDLGEELTHRAIEAQATAGQGSTGQVASKNESGRAGKESLSLTDPDVAPASHEAISSPTSLIGAP
jgi:tetratricopeptide (TPR) repeat protein